MPDLFLSYSRDDTLAMKVIRDNLRRLGFNLWIDIEHLKSGTPQWSRAIKQTIGRIDGVLLLCSPSAEKSEWVNREVHMAQTARKPIFPILILGEDWDAIPANIMGDQYCDMRGRSDAGQGFRDLVELLSASFAFDIPDYDLKSNQIGEIPAVQIINVHGHVEGHVIAVGRDVSGNLNAAGENVTQELTPITPSLDQRPNTSPHILPIKPIGYGTFALVTILLITFGLSRFSNWGNANNPSPTPSHRAATEEILTTSTAEATETVSPTATSIPLGYPGNPVTTNADWISSVVKKFNDVQMVLVPVGCFTMGSNDGNSDEQPMHNVCFEQPFWIDVFEITNGQFDKFDGQAGRSSNWTELDRPRERITWTEAATFCNLRVLGYPLRLNGSTLLAA